MAFNIQLPGKVTFGGIHHRGGWNMKDMTFSNALKRFPESAEDLRAAIGWLGVSEKQAMVQFAEMESDKTILEDWLERKVGREGPPPDEEMLARIVADGKVTVPVVIADMGVRCLLVEGRHRLTAALQAGFVGVPVLCVFPAD